MPLDHEMEIGRKLLGQAESRIRAVGAVLVATLSSDGAR